ncbi:AKAP7 2'5' RNA ligase-like domain-containing protein [Trametes maxima]|nr:AKAP7 2'5' RNA ligase-like domain-containing protein [Trametes maxima]
MFHSPAAVARTHLVRYSIAQAQVSVGNTLHSHTGNTLRERGRGRGAANTSAARGHPVHRADAPGRGATAMAEGGDARPLGGGRGRGRGRGGGRARGRGGALVDQAAPQGSAAKPRLTHFIALPIGHHAGVRETFSAFTNALLEARPAIPGLDATVVVPPRRMHFTLGVMSLDQASKPESTLQAAKRVLEEVRPKILEALGGRKLQVKLERVDIMKPERGDQERAHVMWVGPAVEAEGGRRLQTVAELVRAVFAEAGLVADERRPLKLHCTVVNTNYRKPRGRTRTPFSYGAVLGSDALGAVSARGEGGSGRSGSQMARTVALGEWAIDEVQICEMGRAGPEGEYVAAARCVL